MPRSSHLPLGKTRYPLYRRLGRPQGQFEQVQKSNPHPLGFDSQTVQPVESLYRLHYPRPCYLQCHFKTVQNRPVGDAYSGFTYVMLKETIIFISGQWQESIQNFNFLDLLGNSKINSQLEILRKYKQ
jgi:hypothetical protein